VELTQPGPEQEFLESRLADLFGEPPRLDAPRGHP